MKDSHLEHALNLDFLNVSLLKTMSVFVSHQCNPFLCTSPYSGFNPLQFMFINNANIK